MWTHTESKGNPEYRRPISVTCTSMLRSTTFATDVPEVAEEMVSEAYLDVRLSLGEENPRPFRLSIDRFDAGPFQLDEMDFAASASFAYEPDEEFFVGRVPRGGLRVRGRGVD